MPVAIGAALGVGGSIVNGVMGANAAKKNGKIAAKTAAEANRVATETYDTNVQNFNPYMSTGSDATNSLAGLLGIGGDPDASRAAFENYKNSTNYNFMLDQGLKGVATLNAPSYYSGATAKALNNYAQGMAGQALGGYESILAGLSGQGLNAASDVGQLGQNYSSQYGSNLFGGAQGQIYANNQRTNALAGMTNGITQGLSSFAGSPFGKSLGTSFMNAFGG